ncbi:solute carrier organic anion transporter family member [Elysia marginata]|uniref:Solute carrier organic anion transporter family member n=1 Tax=Elysia marginata TaxID=1093978 RepID=A0AAV4H5L1_9GAST|nr:solute carrier organic anion transporter family member [Elysia marginata]
MVFREKYNISDSTSKKPIDKCVVQLSHLKEKTDLKSDTKSPSVPLKEADANTECGFFCWRPQALQCLAKSLWTFVGFYGFASLCLAATGFYVRSQMTSMERHFRVSTGKMGILMAANDIGSVVAVMFISHFGKFSHIPRILGASTFLGGLCICAIALVQAFDPVTLPSVVSSGFGNANQTSSDPLAALYNNPMLLCVDRPPYFKSLIGDDGGVDFAKLQNMAGSFSGGGGGMNMAKNMEMMGNFPGAGADLEMAKKMEMMRNRTGGEGGMDMEKMMEMVGKSPGFGGGLDMEKMKEMMGKSPGGGASMDKPKNMGNGTGDKGGMGMGKKMEMMKNSTDGGWGMDKEKMMEMMGKSAGADGGMDMASMMNMMGGGEGSGIGGGTIHWGFYYTFVIMVILGVLGSPRIPLQIFYIESNVKDKTESGIKTGEI